MQGELREILADQRDEPGIMRPWGDLREIDLLPPDEELDAEDAPAAEILGYGGGDCSCLCPNPLGHGVRLPGGAIIAVDLDMANRRAEERSIDRPHGQKGDLIVEFNERFQDDLSPFGTPRGLRIFPGACELWRLVDHRLSFS